MPQVPFPHVLSSDLELSRNILRIVSPEILDEGGGMTIREYDSRKVNKKTGDMERVFNIYVFDAISEKRLARGDWSAWELHPTFYKGTGTVTQKFESELSV